MMQNQLSLTPDQTPKITEINLKYTKQMETIMTDKEKPNKMEAMKEMSEHREADLKRVLTAEQFQKFHTAEQQRRDMMQKRMQSKQQGVMPGGAAPTAPQGK